MKLAFMTFSCPELTFEQVLAAAKQYGYAGVEPRIDVNHQHGVEVTADAAARRRIREQAADADVAISCIATSASYADPKAAPQHVEQTCKAIDLAADVGAHRIRVFAGRMPEGVSRTQAVESVSTALRSVADQAKHREVIVCVETHDDWCDPRDVATLMKRINHPNIAVNWDIMHPVMRGNATMDQAYDILKPWVQYVHFHDGTLADGKVTLKTIGEGMIDHARAVTLLKQHGYDGFLSGEWINWEPYEMHLPREIAAMRKLL